MVSRVHRFPLLDEAPRAEPALPNLLLMGTCGVTPLLVGLRNQGIPVSHLLWESLEHSPLPDFDPDQYDALAVSITLLHVFADAAAVMEPERRFGNGIYLPRAIALGRAREYLDLCIEMIQRKVALLLPLCSRKPTFFLSFLEPKHNYLGNLMPCYDVSNPAYFVRKLNEALAEAIAGQANAHFFNMNELLALVGSARVQDDYITLLGHSSVIGNDDTDAKRIQRSRTPWEMWETFDALVEFEKVLAQRFLDDLAIIRSPLRIKAIIVDVDDTLWRGIAAEEPDKPHWEFTEGWPLGVAEALLFYKARGGLLAMCSKNDEATLRNRWPHIYHGRLRLADFASSKVNFERKSDNVREILAELNLLPANVLFIDDNPREIDEVRSVFPEMSFLSADHHDWRRKILMLPDMQVATISTDAALRTSSIQANAARERARVGLSFEEWLLSLDLVQRVAIVSSATDALFDRAFELINKTNQFNTTGRRWQRAEMEDFLASGGVLICSMLRDKMADNGMVSVIAVLGNEIVQAVLSCRAFKYSVEIAAGRIACQMILALYDEVRATLVDTGRNTTCHGYFARLGFEERGTTWIGHAPPDAPSHIRVETADDASAVTGRSRARA